MATVAEKVPAAEAMGGRKASAQVSEPGVQCKAGLLVSLQSLSLRHLQKY